MKKEYWCLARNIQWRKWKESALSFGAQR